MDVVRTLIPAYGDRVAFIHQEVLEGGSPQKLAAALRPVLTPR